MTARRRAAADGAGRGLLVPALFALLALAAAPRPVHAAEECTLDGRRVTPAQRADAPRSGLMRCMDRDSGRLLRESTYDDGHEVGLARSFHANGRLRRAAYYPPMGGESAAAEFTENGQLTALRCGTRALLAPAVDDARLCGFDGRPSAVELFDDKAVLRSRVVWREGKRVRREDLYDNGQIAVQNEQAGDRLTERRFSSEGVLRFESVSRAGPRATVRLSEREFSERGQLVADQRWNDAGDALSAERFSREGQPLSVSHYSGRGLQRVVDTETFHDNGQRATQGRFRALSRDLQRPVGVHLRFDVQGRRIGSSTYDPQGRLTRETVWDATGRIERDEKIGIDGTPQPLPN